MKNIDDEADFDGPLVDYQAKGSQIELAGKDEVAGKAVYKIKLTRKTAESRTYYIDASTFDVVKWDGTTRIEDNDVPVENFLRNYRDVNGLRFPFEIDSDSPGAPQNARSPSTKSSWTQKLKNRISASRRPLLHPHLLRHLSKNKRQSPCLLS